MHFGGYELSCGHFRFFGPAWIGRCWPARHQRKCSHYRPAIGFALGAEEHPILRFFGKSCLNINYIQILLRNSATHNIMIEFCMWCIPEKPYIPVVGDSDWMDLCNSLRCLPLSWPCRGRPAACHADGAKFWWHQHFGALGIGAQSRLIPSSHFSFRPQRPCSWTLQKKGWADMLGCLKHVVWLKIRYPS